MVDVPWPEDLPLYVDATAFVHEAPANVIRTKMDRGPDKVRRRYSVGHGRQSWGIFVTAAQVATFKAWLTNDLREGQRVFARSDPLTRLPGRFRYVPPYDLRPDGVEWYLRLLVDVLPPPPS